MTRDDSPACANFAPEPPAVPSQDLSDEPIQAFLNGGGAYFVPGHVHPHFELLYLLRGARSFRLDGRSYLARAGDLIVFRPGQTHEESSASAAISFIVLRFFPAQFAAAGIVVPDELPPVLRLPNRERFLELFERLLAERRAPRSDSDLLLGIGLLEFVILLGRAVRDLARGAEGERAEGMRRVDSAIALMRENLNQPLGLEEVARRAFLSPSRFSHVFKEQVGTPPKQFQIRERLSRAKKLLRETGLPACEIASALGYETSSFFNRQFKQKTGLTPGEYRRQAGRRAKK